ncbi:MAG TPA: carboxymuconolactone decarboxylase family protein [Acetobacteraceae bacterium]|nr:carboxymuconolactone decarboxylase family protein [Acetobacteraceae bacterium]
MTPRLPTLAREDLDAAQQIVWDSIASSGRGGVGGPFQPLLRSAELCSRVERLGVFLRFECSVPMRLRELAILCVGQHWRAAYEWYAHAPIAARQGVPEAVIAAIGRGEAPPFDSEADRVVHHFVRGVLGNGTASDAAYTAARDLLGERGVVELTALIGYYSLLAFQLNVFQSLPPPEFRAPWA